MSNDLAVFEYAKRMTDAITCLKNSGHAIGGLMLVYAAIDQMAWLSSPSQETHGKEFKEWVDKYILPHNPLGCTSSDLWGARCGLLHTGAAESRELRSGNAQNRIYYTYGSVACTENHEPGVVFIAFERLVVAYLAGVLWFMEDLKINPAMLEVANKKLDSTFLAKSLKGAL